MRGLRLPVLAQNRHGVMSELSPLCAQERTWTIRKRSRGGLIPPPAAPHNVYDSMAKTHARAAEDQG
jgi:hypothetical protein